MIRRILKGLFKFYIGLILSSILFGLLTKNPEVLSYFIDNKYAVHIYTSVVFIISGLFAIDFKYIKNDLKTIYEKCNEFDRRMFSKLREALRKTTE